jgi:hypothetical protein
VLVLAAGSVGAAAVAGFCFAPVEALLEFSPFVAGDRLVFFGWALRVAVAHDFVVEDNEAIWRSLLRG